MKCPSCGANINENHNYCNMCGSVVSKTGENKLSLIIALIASLLTMIGFNTLINVIVILLAITSIIVTIIIGNKLYKICNICLSCYAIVASILWIVLLYV